jgi:hypothetical protein
MKARSTLPRATHRAIRAHLSAEFVRSKAMSREADEIDSSKAAADALTARDFPSERR